jgi:hypothetical protein
MRYRAFAVPMFRWWGFLMTNTRMILLFFLLLIDRAAWFFWIELIAFNVLLVWLVTRQRRATRSLLEMTTAPQTSAHTN